MPDAERDSTQDWLLPAAARPVTVLELEQRVDVALAVARSAEAAAIEIGAAAFDAAEQAHRAAAFAERAVGGGELSELPPLDIDTGHAAGGNGVEAAAPANGAARQAPRNGAEDADDRLKLFSERADRVMTRLRALEPAA